MEPRLYRLITRRYLKKARGVGDFKVFYSRNDKSRKKSIRGSTPLAFPLIDGSLS